MPRQLDCLQIYCWKGLGLVSPAITLRNTFLGTITDSNQQPMRFHNYTELSMPSKVDVFIYTVAMQAFFLLRELGHLAPRSLWQTRREGRQEQAFPCISAAT